MSFISISFSQLKNLRLPLCFVLAGAFLVAVAQEEPTAKPVVYASHAGIVSCHMTMGPTGAKAWMRGYQFVVMSIDQESPAYGTLELKDVVIAADGVAFGPENDARITLGNAIGRAEADGKPLKLTVQRNGKTIDVELALPQLGAFSKTWPYECPKSTKILDAACRSLRRAQLPDGRIITDGSMGTYLGGLLLLGSGDSKYLDAARRAAYAVAAQEHKSASLNNWNAAYGGVFLAEYYLATGDASVLPGLQSRCDQLAEGQMRCGAWGHTTPFGAYGALNQVGVVCTLALVLADECGVKVDQKVKTKALDFFARFAERGAVPYGDGFPYANSLDANGRNASCAILMSLAGRQTEAAALIKSVAMSAWEREEGHTGGFFSMTWGPLVASLAGQETFGAFMDYQTWYYNLARNWKGELVFLPYHEALTRFDSSAYVEFGGDFTTGGLGLAYVLPMRNLRITGAQPSVFAASSKPTGKLAKALAHYRAKEWVACDKVLAEIKPDSLKTEQAAYWLEQLRRLRNLLNASMDRVYLEVENNLLENAPYRADQQFTALKRFMGEKVDPRHDVVEKQLSGQSYGIGEGKKFYDTWSKMKTRAFMGWTPQGAVAKDILEGLPTLQKPLWEPLSRISSVVPQAWNTLLLEPGGTLPENWNKPDFDDSKWMSAEGIKTRFQAAAGEKLPPGIIAARRIFKVDNPAGVDLKIRLQTVRRALTQVYLNGVLIVTTVRGKRGGYASIPLDRSVLKVLRKGENLLAVTCDKQGDKGNRLDIGLYVNREPVETRKLPVARASALALTEVAADATLRVRETKDKVKKALEDGVMAMDIPKLVNELKSPVGYYRHLVERALVAKGAAGLQAVLPLAKTKDWKTRSAYCAVAGGIADRAFRNEERVRGTKLTKDEKEVLAKVIKPHVPRLTTLLDDTHFWVRVRAARALARFDASASSALPKLTTMIHDPDPWVRIRAMEAVEKLQTKPEAAVAAAVEALKVPNASYAVPGRALRVFKKYDGVKTGRLEAVVTMLKNHPEGGGGKLLHDYMAMGVALDPAGTVMIPVLVDAILDKTRMSQQQANPRGKALELLEAYGDHAKPKTIPALKTIMQSERKRDQGLKKAALKLLERWGEDVSIYDAKDEKK